MLWLPWSWIAHVQTDSTDEMGRSLCQLLNNMMVSLSTVRNVFSRQSRKYNQFNHAVRINNNVQQHHITTNLRYVIYQKAGKQSSTSQPPQGFQRQFHAFQDATVRAFPPRQLRSSCVSFESRYLSRYHEVTDRDWTLWGSKKIWGWILRKDVQDVRSSVDIILFNTFPSRKVIG